MTWFKVDDGFYDHPKVATLSMAARGLWVSAGSYCARHLTDGVITARQVRVLGGTKTQINALLEEGLWRTIEGEKGAKSYAFHDWFSMQPSRKEVEEKRESARERKRDWRANKTGENAATSDNEEMSQRDGTRDGTRDNACDFPVRHASPDPTRPDPTIIVTPANNSYVPREAELAAGEKENFEDPLAAASRRAREAGIPDHVIAEGCRRFQAKPPPKGPGLLRTLIDEAHREHNQATSEAQAKQARREARDSCQVCHGDLTITLSDGTAWKCPHDGTQPPTHTPNYF